MLPNELSEAQAFTIKIKKNQILQTRATCITNLNLQLYALLGLNL